MSTSLISLNDVAALNHWEQWMMLSDSKHGSTSNTQASSSSSILLTETFDRQEKNKLHRLQNMSKLERTMHGILVLARKNMKVILQAPALSKRDEKNQYSPISFRNPSAEKYVEKYADACRGKEKLVDIVFASSEGSDNFNTMESSPELCQVLPTIQGIIDVHGSHGPIVYGLETCAAYQEKVQKLAQQHQQQNASNIPRPGPRVGGLYHSGTNALVRTFENNLPPLPRMSKWDSPFELPWGKHVPAKYRLQNRFPKGNPDVQELVLPVILIRNPFHWMSNMCKNGYDAKFNKIRIGCPRLILDNNQTNPVVVRADQTGFRFTDNYESLADMWSEWYRQYLEADYPRLIIRYEDTILHAPEILQVIRVCSGSESIHADPNTFVYHAKEARLWGGKGSLLGALSKLGEQDLYWQQVGGRDQEYLKQKGLDGKLMQIFQYPHVSNITRNGVVVNTPRQAMSPQQRLIDRLMGVKPPVMQQRGAPGLNHRGGLVLPKANGIEQSHLAQILRLRQLEKERREKLARQDAGQRQP